MPFYTYTLEITWFLSLSLLHFHYFFYTHVMFHNLHSPLTHSHPSASLTYASLPTLSFPVTRPCVSFCSFSSLPLSIAYSTHDLSPAAPYSLPLPFPRPSFSPSSPSFETSFTSPSPSLPFPPSFLHFRHRSSPWLKAFKSSSYRSYHVSPLNIIIRVQKLSSRSYRRDGHCCTSGQSYRTSAKRYCRSVILCLVEVVVRQVSVTVRHAEVIGEQAEVIVYLAEVIIRVAAVIIHLGKMNALTAEIVVRKVEVIVRRASYHRT